MLHIAMATHSLKGILTNWVLKISDDVIVTSFLNQSQQKFEILLEILSCTFVPNLSKIGLLMFPSQHIFESAHPTQ